MFDSYLNVGVMPSEDVPAAETDDYANVKRTFDAKYLSLSKGLLEVATWNRMEARADGRPGNAVKTANTAVPRKVAAPAGEGDGSGDGADGSADDGEADPAGATVWDEPAAEAGDVTATETLADDTTRTTTTRTDGTTWVKDETAAGAVSITYTFTLDTAVARGASYDTDGNLVMPASLWNDGYFHNLRVDVAHFNAGVREDANAAIDVLGRTDVVDKNVKLESVFNTDYDANSATVLDSTLLDGAAEGLRTILEATRHLEVLTALGMPVRAGGKLFNCAVVIQKGRVSWNPH